MILRGFWPSLRIATLTAWEAVFKIVYLSPSIPHSSTVIDFRTGARAVA